MAALQEVCGHRQEDLTCRAVKPEMLSGLYVAPFKKHKGPMLSSKNTPHKARKLLLGALISIQMASGRTGPSSGLSSSRCSHWAARPCRR